MTERLVYWMPWAGHNARVLAERAKPRRCFGWSSPLSVCTMTSVQGLPSATGGPSPGNFNSCAISGSDLICWGQNAPGGVLGRGSLVPATGAAGKATAIEAGVLQGSPGYDYSLALLADGTVLSWGNNATGQLGRVTGGTDIVPKPVASITGVTQVSAGLDFACAVNGAGAIYCWGDNTYAQIGQGAASNQPVNVPVVVPMPGSKKATQVSCANYHSCALMTDGSVACWGRNNSGQSGGFAGDAGDAAYNPVPVPTAETLYLETPSRRSWALPRLSTGMPVCRMVPASVTGEVAPERARLKMSIGTWLRAIIMAASIALPSCCRGATGQ